MRFLIVARNEAVGVQATWLVPPAPAHHFDFVIRIPDGDVRPGLINAHDHLHRNHYGRLGAPPYANAYEWGRDIHARDAETISAAQRLPRSLALRVGAWKNLFAGVTTVVHHDAWEAEFNPDFPIRVVRVRCAHSLGFERSSTVWQKVDEPFAVHIAEGIDTAAAEEVRELDRRGLVDSRLLAVHAVGVDDDGIARLRGAGAAVVWCPTSNLFLFGRTAPPSLLASGIDLLLGSDSLLSGTGTLLDELRVARSLGIISDERLADAVGEVAARRLGISEPTLEAGAVADLVVLRRPLLEATTDDVAAVIVGGVPRVLDPALASSLSPVLPDGEFMTRDGVTRWVLTGPLELHRRPAYAVTHDGRPHRGRA